MEDFVKKWLFKEEYFAARIFAAPSLCKLMNAVCMTNDPSTKQHFGAGRDRGGAFCAFNLSEPNANK